MGRRIQPPLTCTSTGWTTPEGQDGLKPFKQLILPTPAVRNGRLTGRKRTPTKCPVTANAIAAQLLKSSQFQGADKNFTRLILHDLSSLSRASSAADMSRDFTTAKLRAAIGHLRQGKSPGNIHWEFLIHQSETSAAWLCSFFNSCIEILNCLKPKSVPL